MRYFLLIFGIFLFFSSCQRGNGNAEPVIFYAPVLIAEVVESFPQLVENDFIYIENDLGVRIIRYIGTARDVIIPGVINNRPVTHIGAEQMGISSFAEHALVSVVIPSSVTHIATGAFFGHGITNVIIPSSVIYIGNFAFYGNNLTNITIPNSVIYIGNFAFGQTDLSSVVIPNSVTYIGEEAFDSSVEIIRQ